MKKILLSLFVVAFATSCGTSSLYYWGDTNMRDVTAYESLSYKRVAKGEPKVICQVIEMYEDLLAYPGGLRQVPPSGICVEYAYVLMQPESVELFYNNATKEQIAAFENSPYGSEPTAKAIKLLEKELELYPESSKTVTPLLNRLNNK